MFGVRHTKKTGEQQLAGPSCFTKAADWFVCLTLVRNRLHIGWPFPLPGRVDDLMDNPGHVAEISV